MLPCVSPPGTSTRLRARQERVEGWLAEVEPDVVLLQEIKVTDDSFPGRPIEELGYNLAVVGEPGHNGVAILAKSPIEDVTRGLPGDDDDARRATSKGP